MSQSRSSATHYDPGRYSGSRLASASYLPRQGGLGTTARNDLYRESYLQRPPRTLQSISPNPRPHRPTDRVYSAVSAAPSHVDDHYARSPALSRPELPSIPSARPHYQTSTQPRITASPPTLSRTSSGRDSGLPRRRQQLTTLLEPAHGKQPAATFKRSSTDRIPSARGRLSLVDQSPPPDTSIVQHTTPQHPQLPATGSRTGLQNLGNTCFMNAILQCLAHLPRFVTHFLNSDGHRRARGVARTPGHTALAADRDRHSQTRRPTTAQGITGTFVTLLEELWTHNTKADGAVSASSYGDNSSGSRSYSSSGSSFTRDSYHSYRDTSAYSSRNYGTSTRLYASGRYGGAGATAVAPHALKAHLGRFAPRFVGYMQQDAQELLGYLLDALHEDLNEADAWAPLPPFDENAWETLSTSAKAQAAYERHAIRNRSPIDTLFGGWLQSTLTCTQCGKASVTFDPMLGLSLPFPADASTHRTAVTLEACLAAFTAAEVIDGDERPTCSHCKTKTRCEKMLQLEQLPRILVVHLKRFEHSLYRRSKITVPVNYPTKSLKLEPYCTARANAHRTEYDLCGVTKHMGNMGGGHYTAVCRTSPSTWHTFNDATVSLAQDADIQSTSAYVLFYERADLR